MEGDNTDSSDRNANAGSPPAALDLPSMLAQAVAAHRQGQISAARAGYEEILRHAPEHFDALHLLGVVALQEMRAEEGVALIRRALEANRRNAIAHLNLARGLTDLGRLDDALESLDLAIELKPDYAEAHSNRGHVLAELKRPDEALASCDRAIELNPGQAVTHNNRANALLAVGRPAEALKSCDRAIALAPAYAEAHCNHGKALQMLGQFAEALASYDRAIARKPAYALAWSSRADSLRRLGRLDEALTAFDRAIALRPDHSIDHVWRGNVLCALGRFSEALPGFDRAIAIDPDSAIAHSERSNVLRELKRPAEALESADRAIALDAASSFDGHINRGNALQDLGRPLEALESFDRAIASDPDQAIAHSNRGHALQTLGRHAEALESCDRAIALDPDRFEAHNNRGVALLALGRPVEALVSCARSVALKPDFVKGRWNECMCRLLMGDYKTGWKQYECRREKGSPAPIPLDFAQPLWLGDANLRGKTILLHAEQGFGDTLQFVRYAPLVARLGARVLLLVHRPLKSLLAGMEGVTAVYAGGDAMPDFDFHCPMMSLPLAFETDLTTIPADIPYLHADPARAARWRERLEGRELKIGLVWAGSAREEHPSANLVDRRRSMRLAQLAPLADVPGVRFVSLQKGSPAEQARQPPPRMAIADYTDELDDFADTAALVSALDLVISVDTSVVHLTGGMGKPVWILSRFDGCWRWLLDRDDSPWYPSARLFRQSGPGDWAGVVGRVAAALHRWRRA